MVGKAPGFVLCAHCGERTGERDCPGCQRMVCAPCAADIRSCPVPHVRRIDLGELLDGGSYLVLEIDSAGQRALVARRRSLMQRIFGAEPPVRLLDLTCGRLQPLPPGCSQASHLTADGWLVWADAYAVGESLQSILCWARSGDDEPGSEVFDLPRLTGLTADDRAAWSIHDNLLQLFTIGDWTLQRQSGLPLRLAIQAAAVTGQGGYLAIGTWSALHLYRLGDGDRGKLRHTHTVELPAGDVVACVGRGSSITCLVRELDDCHLRLFDIAADGQLVQRRLPRIESAISRRHLVDVDGSGRWLAVVGDDGVVSLCDLSGPQVQILADHEDEVSVLRLADDGSALVTADERGVVVLRPLGLEL